MLKLTLEAYEFTEVAKGRVLWNALLMVERAKELMPGNLREDPYLYSLHAEFLIESQSCKGALEQLDRALELNPDSYKDWLRKGKCQQRMLQIPEALDSFRRSNRVLPNAIATKALADLSYLTSNRNEAKRHYLVLMGSSVGFRQEAERMFVQMDIVDNLRNYFRSTSTVEDGEFTSILYSMAGHSVKKVEVSFQITVDGKNKQKKMKVGPLQAHSTLQLYPGWKVVGLFITMVDISGLVVFAAAKTGSEIG